MHTYAHTNGANDLISYDDMIIIHEHIRTHAHTHTPRANFNTYLDRQATPPQAAAAKQNREKYNSPERSSRSALTTQGAIEIAQLVLATNESLKGNNIQGEFHSRAHSHNAHKYTHTTLRIYCITVSDKLLRCPGEFVDVNYVYSRFACACVAKKAFNVS